MKSPRDTSMILVATISAGAVVLAAGLTSGHAFSSLVRGAAVEPVADIAADTLELPIEVVEEAAPVLRSGVDPAAIPVQTSVPRVDDLSETVVEQVKSEMTRLSALTDGVPERVQALADQVTDGSGKIVIIVYWDEADEAGPAWTHTAVASGTTVRAQAPETVVAHVESWIAAQEEPNHYEFILQD